MSEWVAEKFPMPIDEYAWRSSYGAAVPVVYAGGSQVNHVDELVALYGEPDLILEARPRYGEFRDGIPALSYVYRPRGGRLCHETFVVIMATGRVARFYCR
jgi:hypothetical protein